LFFVRDAIHLSAIKSGDASFFCKMFWLVVIMPIREEREGTMHWIHLILAIVFEVAGTTCMKLSAGFSRLLPAVLLGVFYAASFYFLTLALKKVDVSIAYAIWSGVGTALIVSIGVLWFHEPITLLKTFGLLAVIGGVTALSLSGGTH
jgi:small multidrug resistance pump